MLKMLLQLEKQVVSKTCSIYGGHLCKYMRLRELYSVLAMESYRGQFWPLVDLYFDWKV